MPRGTGFSLTNLPPSHRPAGCEHLQNDHGVIVDFNTADPLIRWDSYENLSADGEGESGYLVSVAREWGPEKAACARLDQKSPCSPLGAGGPAFQEPRRRESGGTRGGQAWFYFCLLITLVSWLCGCII